MRQAPSNWPRISTAIYYQDASGAIDWLCAAFGFEVRLKIETDDGRIEHSELTFGDGVLMVGEENGRDGPVAHRKSPKSVSGANTQNVMIYVDDAMAHCERARAAGATITVEPKVSD